jgi:hypothetical protein
MKVLRKTRHIELSEGSLQASGLYNLYDVKNDLLSNWFDEETKDELMGLSDYHFHKKAKNFIKESN